MESESEYFVINVNLYLVQSSARIETKIMALQDWDQNKAHEKNIHGRAPPPNSLLRRSLYYSAASAAFSVVETILPVSSL